MSRTTISSPFLFSSKSAMSRANSIASSFHLAVLRSNCVIKLYLKEGNRKERCVNWALWGQFALIQDDFFNPGGAQAVHPKSIQSLTDRFHLIQGNLPSDPTKRQMGVEPSFIRFNAKLLQVLFERSMDFVQRRAVLNAQPDHSGAVVIGKHAQTLNGN